MQRLEITVKFFLALASTVCLLIGGVVLPAAGVLLIPFVPQPVLFFRSQVRHRLRWGSSFRRSSYLLCVCRGSHSLSLFHIRRDDGFTFLVAGTAALH